MRCEICRAGFFTGLESKNTACNECAPGFYAPPSRLGQSSCLLCDTKTSRYTNVSAEGECKRCPAGYDTAGERIPTHCERCQRGQFAYAETGAVACTMCPVGKFSDTEEAIGCKACVKSEMGVNYYGTERGQSSCSICASGMFTNRDAKTLDEGAVRCEQVPENNMYLVQKVDEKTGMVTEVAEKCPVLGFIKEAECSNGQLVYHSGYWHDGLVKKSPGHYVNSPGFVLKGSDGHHFYTCLQSEACVVDSATGAVNCTGGTDGLLCALCGGGYYRNADRTCSECTEDDKNMTGVWFVFVFIALAAGLYLFVPLHHLPRKAARPLRTAAKGLYKFGVKIGLVAMVKIVCSFYQVLLLLGDIYDIPFPRNYLDFIYRYGADVSRSMQFLTQT